MKTLFKILRSSITSFLFIILTITIVVQFFFTMIRSYEKRLSDLINRESLYTLLAKDIIIKDNQLFKNISINYIEDYINYVFYKRSFPSIDLDKIETMNEETKKSFVENANIIKNKIDLEYDTILKIRDVNNFISNGSIYLLLNIAIIFLFTLISIIKNSFFSGFKHISISLIFSSLFILITGVIINSKMINSASPKGMIFYENFHSGTYISQFFKLVMTYMILGIISYICLFIIGRLIKK